VPIQLQEGMRQPNQHSSSPQEKLGKIDSSESIGKQMENVAGVGRNMIQHIGVLSDKRQP
jgi:hypothetical protein